MTDERAERLLAGVDDPLTVVQAAGYNMVAPLSGEDGLPGSSRGGTPRTGGPVPSPESGQLHSVRADSGPEALTGPSGSPPTPATPSPIRKDGDSSGPGLHSVKADRHADVIRAQLKVLEDDINEAWRAVELSRERMDVRSSPSMYAVAQGCDWRAATFGWLARREVERAGLFRRLGDLHDEERED